MLRLREDILLRTGLSSGRTENVMPKAHRNGIRKTGYQYRILTKARTIATSPSRPESKCITLSHIILDSCESGRRPSD
jgi:hypothetical protein